LVAAALRVRGIGVEPWMTAEEALQRLAAADPEEANRLRPLIDLYEEEQFSTRPDPARRKAIRRMLAELKSRTT
ncbi:MAG: DUF4129 domain-containing protein, partial [Thermoanaerobaculia bacterium]